MDLRTNSYYFPVQVEKGVKSSVGCACRSPPRVNLRSLRSPKTELSQRY